MKASLTYGGSNVQRENDGGDIFSYLNKVGYGGVCSGGSFCDAILY